MTAYRNLRLAHRLAISFGALGVALLVVVAVGLHGLGTSTASVRTIDERGTPAVQLAGKIEARAQSIAALVSQHLYVYDGDLRQQDRLQREILALRDANAADTARLGRLAAGTPVTASLEALAQVRTRYVAAWSTAIKRSRAETVAGAEDRSGSRDQFVGQVIPLARQVSQASQATVASVGRAIDVRSNEAVSAGNNSRRLMLLVAVLSVLAAAAIAVSTIRSVTGPVRAIGERVRSLSENCLQALVGGLSAVAGGDLTKDAQPVTTPIEVRSTDELGQLSLTFNAMIGQAQEGIRSYNSMRAQLSDLIGELASSAGTVSSASDQLTATSEETSKAVNEVATAIVDVATGAESQVERLGEVQTAMGHNVAAVAETGRSAEEAAAVAERARGTKDEGVDAVQSADAAMTAVRDSSRETAEAMASLAEKSQRIGEFVETITGISSQTNLLALNAAIEAARAGEQGRGFAVVAEEVRKLAEESNEAAGTIAGLVAEIEAETARTVGVVEDGVHRTEQGAETVASARAAFDAIGTAVDDMAARIAAIAAASQEIGASSERVSADINGVASLAESSSATAEQVSASTQETSASAEQISASAQELSATAQVLEQLVLRFRVATS
ncbi:HAMP domain-containing methyl-accepting chemotaxis protein [Patulibacter sp. SYSU D01012]|uniref:methyl-accepting chemotaxis protein n=1 Tax=Patulibacter sp. SYSU D01012 TaxID=2817381 RepID=UPI001B312D9B|nr:HAMP domain-containing methyl-accepting chemotaxis protein [Patulibacter sp. SYSU D01012]